VVPAETPARATPFFFLGGSVIGSVAVFIQTP
jgi:hypothetical protein